MGQLLTSTQMYPPAATPTWFPFLYSLTTGDRNERGNFVLRRQLTLSERDTLKARATQLAPWITPERSPSGHKEAIMKMMLCFGGAALDSKEAAVIVTEYVQRTKDIPLWAVARACIRFSNNEVTAAELGVKSYDTSFRPGAGQLRQVAMEILRPTAEESTRIHMTLRGTVEVVVTPEERARVGEQFTDFAAALAATADRSRIGDDASVFKQTASAKDFWQRHALADWERAGLEPRYNNAGHLQLLSTYIANGWTIDKSNDVPRLVPPQQTGRRVTEGT